MSGADAGRELLELVARRRELLVRLSEAPADKRTLDDSLDVSRSTLDRALRELAMVDLVQYAEGRYETTLAGELALEIYRESHATMTDLLAARELLEPLPAGLGLDPAALAGAEIALAGGPTPYGPLDRVRELIEDAVDMLGVGQRLTDPRLLAAINERVVDGGADISIVFGETLLAQLVDREPEALHELAATERADVHVVEHAPYSLLVADDGDQRRAALIVYDDGLHGVAVSAAPEAVDWATEQFRALREQAVEVTAALAGDDRLDYPGAILETEGVVELTPAYFEAREPRDPSVCWRTELDLVEVRAGHALDREHDRDGERVRLADDLVARLQSGEPTALVGPPGSGKSTVCRSVACRWREADHGPVFYRRSGRDPPLSATGLFESRLRQADGHALVVVEDAPRADASAVFELLRSLRATENVSFLLDARTAEWRDPPDPPTGAVETYRQSAVETVRMPPLDERECARFVEHFEATLDRSLGVSPAELFESVRSERDGDAAEPAALLLLLHRLALHADPLSAYADTPTSLAETVRRTDAELDGLAREAAVLVNLWNAAGFDVDPGLVRALADDPAAAEAALDRLDGRITFGRDDGHLRTVHETWSTLYLEELLARDRETARRLVCRSLESVLALADRDDSAVVGSDPAAWVESVVEGLFAFGREHPGLAPLFGRSDDGGFALPDAAPPVLALRCTAWRGETYLDGGYFDAAEREFDLLATRTAAREDLPSETATEFRARAARGFGKVARRRGDLADAETHHREALEHYRALGDDAGVAGALNNLGAVAWARGDLDAAEEWFAESLASKRETGDRRGVANALNNLGIVAGTRGDLEAAATHHEESLAIREEIGDRRGRADSHTNLGVVAHDRDDLEAAERHARRGLELWRDIGDRHGEANGLYQLGELAHERGNLDDSAAYLQESLAIREDIGDDQGRADTVRLLGAVARDRGDLETAAERAETALAAYREIEDRRGEAQARRLLGTIARERGDLDAATTHLAAAADRFEAVGAMPAAVEALADLADVHETAGAPGTAADVRERAIDLADEAGLENRHEMLVAERSEN